MTQPSRSYLRAVSRCALVALSALACTGSAVDPTHTHTVLEPNFLSLGWSGNRVAEVGSAVSYTASVMRSGGGFAPNMYFHLDTASWSTTNSGVAVVERVRVTTDFDEHFAQYRTSTALFRAVGPGAALVNVSTPQWRTNTASGNLYVMPQVRAFALHATRDTMYAGDTAYVYPVAELVDGSAAAAYFRAPYLNLSQQQCSIACPATVEWTGAYASGHRLIANDVHAGVVTFNASYGERSVVRHVVVLTGARP